PNTGQRLAAIYEPGTAEHSLLYGKLARPRDRAQRGNAHRAPEPIKRWQSAVHIVIRDYLQGPQFKYSKVKKGEIRILCLHPGSGNKPLKASLFKRNLEDVFDGYEALSYCWGGPNERNTHEILIRDLNATLPDFGKETHKTNAAVKWRMAVKATGETPFPIRKNLHQALLKLRSIEHDVNIWVDAICIDQTERGKEEKEEQLSRMTEIYNSASNVCIWLGDAYERAGDGIQLVRDIMNFKTFDILIDLPEAKDRWMSLIELMKAPWFGRRWIIQEVALSRNATIHCADHVIHWDDFADAVSLLKEKIEILRNKFRDEIFDDLETSSACILVDILTNVCRKSDDGKVLENMLDLETLVSTLLGFQATYPRDTIYSILSLARDSPQASENWEMLHSSQLERNYHKRNHQNIEWAKRRRLGSAVGLTPNYKFSTRDLFVAFVTRCIYNSGCLDIICRHWAPRVFDRAYNEEVVMPSWVSGMSKAPYGIPGTSLGRQNGENFVAYTPNDQRRRYNASGSYRAKISMVDDPSLDPQETMVHSDRLRTNITDTAFTGSPLPSPTLEKNPSSVIDSITEQTEPSQNAPSYAKLNPNGQAAELTTESQASTVQPQLLPTFENGSRPIPPAIEINALSIPSRSPLPSPNQALQDRSPISPWPGLARPSPSRKPTKTIKSPDVEREHELSGILSVKGFILCQIKEHSDVMRGGIIQGEWVEKMGWEIGQTQNRVPDMLWRLLVADRGCKGGKPPQWYKRACLHGLVDSRVADAEGNLHSLMPADRKISEYTTKYFERVRNVVWNRRLIKAETTEWFRGPLFGLAPKDCEAGDIVCILLGCSVPVVLKRVKGHREISVYQLVGEAYIHGMMDGEAVQDKSLVEKLATDF
ncbi:hypothetical protein K432DRAFT_262851, partial [Lepidopterella palustris CBS 459.81]